MTRAKQVVKGKVIRKDWYPIKATKEFESTFLGESYVSGPEMLIDRHLTANLANLTGDIRQQGISLKFRITGVDEGAGVAEVVGYEASSSQLRRLVRRGIDRLDDSIQCKTVDGQTIVVKPFAVTKTATGNSKIAKVRAILRKAITEEAARHNFDGLIKLVISNKFQMDLKNVAKKVYPLKSLEIRRLEVLSGEAAKAPAAVAEVGEAEAKAPEAAEPAEPAPETKAEESAAKEKPKKEKKKRAEEKTEEAEEAKEAPAE